MERKEGLRIYKKVSQMEASAGGREGERDRVSGRWRRFQVESIRVWMDDRIHGGTQCVKLGPKAVGDTRFVFMDKISISYDNIKTAINRNEPLIKNSG